MRRASVRRLGAGCAIAFALAGAAPAGAATGLAFLKNGVDARAVIMGHAVTAAVDDASACYWNPAGLASGHGPQLLLSHVESFADLRHEFAAITQPLKGSTTVGLAFNGIWTDNLEGFDESAEPTGSFGYAGYSAALAVGFAGPWGARLGLSGQYLNESISSYTASGWAVDVGCQWSPSPTSPLTFGFAARHLGPSMSFIAEEFDLPLTLQGGVAWQRPFSGLGGAVTVAAEVRHVRDQGAGLLLGAEYLYRETLSFGAGYLGGEDSRGASLGMGIHHGIVGLHYGYVPVSQEDIGDDEHRLSLRFDL